MASIGNWVGDRLEIDMTGNSDDIIKVEFGQKLKKDIPNSIQIIGKDLGGSVRGDAGLRITNLDLNDPDYSDSYLDILGYDVSIKSSNFSETYQTDYAYNTALVYLQGVDGINAGKFIIVLNKD
jgi:hypothetical protein